MLTADGTMFNAHGRTGVTAEDGGRTERPPAAADSADITFEDEFVDHGKRRLDLAIYYRTRQRMVLTASAAEDRNEADERFTGYRKPSGAVPVLLEFAAQNGPLQSGPMQLGRCTKRNFSLAEAVFRIGSYVGYPQTPTATLKRLPNGMPPALCFKSTVCFEIGPEARRPWARL